MTRIAVVTADGARELDARTIATLPSSFVLMQRAAQAAAEWLHAREWRSAAVFVGTGNNGGDGWLIAGLLRERGWTITVHASGEPRTDDARRARIDAEREGPFAMPTGHEAVMLDALLGTGSAGTPRAEVAEAMSAIRARAGGHCAVVAIDLPTGLDATTGADTGAVPAAITLTFGSVKRGQLLRRDLVGELVVLNIGLVEADVETPRLVTSENVLDWLPAVPANAYKGTRGRVAIIGGEAGMAGAVILAARGAHASGAGMVRADVDAQSAFPLQIAAPFATVKTWRSESWRDIDSSWPDAMVIGPGLDGTSPHIRERVLELLHRFTGPVVLDAGALTAFRSVPQSDIDEVDVADGTDDGLDSLRDALSGRPALLTPHVGEFERLFSPGEAPTDRFDAPRALARVLNATVLLKGVPTVLASPDGSRYVTATGNPALAMGGTGDLLSGIAGALLAQGLSPLHAGAAAAWVHGTAAEHATTHHGSWRGVTMDLLLHEVSNVWPRLVAHTSHSPHTLLSLPAVPCR